MIFGMPKPEISKAKINVIRRYCIAGKIRKYLVAKELSISTYSVYRYAQQFKEMEQVYPGKIHDEGFFMPINKRVYPKSGRYQEMLLLIPFLMKQLKTPRLWSMHVWKLYKVECPHGYNFKTFHQYFSIWCQENNICVFSNNKIESISPQDNIILGKWRNSNNKNQWDKAVVIMGSAAGESVKKLAGQVEKSVETVQGWILQYQQMGISSFIKQPYLRTEEMADRIALKSANLMRLLHESPKLHGLNRTAWTIKDLADKYLSIHGTGLARTSIAKYLKINGYGIKKSQKVLTSPDPNFREKLAHIKQILYNLGENERFFSIDEYGPASVKIKGGRSLVYKNDIKTVPVHQRCKGRFICTAALELSTNQVTHFYSKTKNTEEMVKLIRFLLRQYRNVDKLYLSWDAASWHQSKRLQNFITLVNENSYRKFNRTPLVELTPLPASAQFLNVIESVFSGMAKSVIHNSDYASINECQQAINIYFQERNEHFLQNPHKAGNKIWGNEVVKPSFDDAQNCKDPRLTW